MLDNFLIRTVNRDDLVRTKRTRLYKIKRPYDKTRKVVVCINHKPKWFLSTHCEHRMQERNISFFEVFKTIRFGESIYGETNLKSRSTVFFDRKSRIIVVTSGNGEVLITCWRSLTDESFEEKIKEYLGNVSLVEEWNVRREKHAKNKFKSKTVWKDDSSFGNFIKF